MAYKALYRTYRPTTFEEVAGQQHIVKTLKNALSTGKIAHAYLFAGPRGTGKTTMAKLLAKALNCEQGIGHQCNTCKNCIAINEGSHPDVLEIDAASNNGVDEIRDLIDKVKYGTILGKYKVYIIDEVHMMTSGAFNALLKTLEEPPEHVIFILATTEPHKILPTILSRCQRYDFTKVSDNDIRNRIKVILEKEGINYNEDAINLIIKLSDGGMRDALSILDQVLAYSNDQLNVQDILDIFALESTEEKIKLLEAIARGNLKEVLNRFNNYIAKGTDIKRLTNDLLVMYKDLLIYDSTSNEEHLEILNKEEIDDLLLLIPHDKILQCIDLLLDTIKDFKNVNSIASVLEISLLKLVNLFQNNNPNAQIEFVKPVVIKKEEKEIIEKPVEVKPVENINVTPSEKVAPATINIEESPKKEAEQISIFTKPEVEDLIPKVILDKKLKLLPAGVDGENLKIDDKLMINIMVTSKKEIKKQFLDGWGNIQKYIANPDLGKYAAMLVDGHPLVVSNDILVIEFPLNKLVEKANTLSNQEGLQNVINNIFNKKMFIYAVNRGESVRLQKLYTDLLQVNKLPKAKDINLEFTEEE